MCAWTRTLIGGASSVGAGSPATFTTLSLTADTSQVVLDSDGTNPVTLTIVAPTAPRTISLPNATDTLVGKATTDTLTNKTLTAPAVSAPVLSGTATGTYTLGGTPTVVAPVFSGTATGTYTLGGTPFLPTVSGAVTFGSTVTLNADPASALQAATKQYVDGLFVLKDAQTSTVDVANTVTETNLYSVSLPQNTLTAGRALRLLLWGDVLKNATGTLQIRVKFGATTLFDTGADTPATSASRQIHMLLCEIFAVAANSQIAWVRKVPSGGGLSTYGATALSLNGTTGESVAEASAAEDNGAGAKTLAVTAQWSAASPSLSARALGVKTLVFG